MSYDPTGPGTEPGRPMGEPGMRPAPGAAAMHDTQYEPAYDTQRTSQFEQQDRGYDRQSHSSGPNAGVMTPYGRPGVYIYPFWQRSEFWAFLLTAIAIGIAAAIADSFDARGAWQLIAGLAAAYILSRGFAKREPREDDDDRPWTPGSGGGGGGGGRGSNGRFARR